MTEIIGIRFNTAGKIYYFDPSGKKVDTGMGVIVETARGVEFGTVAIANKLVDESEVIQPLKPITRIATNADYDQLEKNKEKEKDAFRIANEKIAEHKLGMHLVNTEYTFDGSKILFHTTYFNLLKHQILEMSTIEEVEAVTYGMELKPEYQSTLNAITA